MSGNVKLALTHVVPDLVNKVLRGQDPLHILGDGRPGAPLHLRRRPGARHPPGHGVADSAINEDFNLSTAQRTTVLELAELIWRKINGERPLTIRARRAVRARRAAPRARRRARRSEVLGFEATTTLDEMLDEVIPWIRGEL